VTISNGRTPTRVGCAIYTRKSTEEGLEQEFNSLDAQREAGEAYIASQRLSGWTCLPERYDDGGYTGGNMERPALAQLLSAIQAGKIQVVVVYKVDRLSRSLLDFARLPEIWDLVVAIAHRDARTRQLPRACQGHQAQFERNLQDSLSGRWNRVEERIR
jgi:site-specific DNA recombinase